MVAGQRAQSCSRSGCANRSGSRPMKCRVLNDEDRNPVETELESFFNDSRTGGHPKADLEVGLNDSKAVILSNLCMDQDRKVQFSEFDTLGRDVTPQQWQANVAKAEQSYINSLAAKKKMPA